MYTLYINVHTKMASTIYHKRNVSTLNIYIYSGRDIIIIKK